MSKAKRARAKHGHDDHGHGHDDHAHDAHDTHAHEPPPPPEPETPLWFTMLGGILFAVAALAALVLAGEDDPAKADAAKKPSAAATPTPAPGGGDPDAAAAARGLPRGATLPVRRLQPGDIEKKRLARISRLCRIVPNRTKMSDIG